MSDSVRDQVIAIIANQAMVDTGDVADTTTLTELGIDSMGLVEAIFSIEEALDIQIPFNANAPDKTEFDVSSVAAIVRAVEALIADQT